MNLADKIIDKYLNKDGVPMGKFLHMAMKDIAWEVWVELAPVPEYPDFEEWYNKQIEE